MEHVRIENGHRKYSLPCMDTSAIKNIADAARLNSLKTYELNSNEVSSTTLIVCLHYVYRVEVGLD